MANVAWLVNAVTGAPAYSGRMVRQAMSVALGGATAARPLGARSGVRPGTPTTTVALPTATSYVIHPHAGVLDTQASAFAGPYWYVVGSDGADETGTVNAAHGTWPRKDILWVRIDDPAEEGTDPPLVVTGYTAGTAAASPAVPATPARAMRLATISVPLSGGGAPTIVFDAPVLTPPGTLDPAVTATSTLTTGIGGAWVVLVTAPAVTGDGVKKFQIAFAYSEAYSTVPGDACRFGIRRGATDVGIQQEVVLSNSWANGRTMVMFDTPPAGTVTYTANAYIRVGSGSASVNPSQIIVQHIA